MVEFVFPYSTIGKPCVRMFAPHESREGHGQHGYNVDHIYRTEQADVYSITGYTSFVWIWTCLVSGKKLTFGRA